MKGGIQKEKYYGVRCPAASPVFMAGYPRGNVVVKYVEYNAELRIPGDLIYLRPVRSFVRELALNIGFSDERVSEIELVVDEVFSNAIEHGSTGSGSQILVHCFTTEEMMKIKISDTGPGEGPNTRWINAWSDALRDKVQPDTERGHGLFLVHQLTNEMNIEPNSVGGIDVLMVLHKEGKLAEKR